MSRLSVLGGINTPKLIDPFVESADFLKYLKKIKTFEEIRIVYFGTPEFSAYILERLIEESGGGNVKFKFVVSAVVTNPVKPVGRKKEYKETAVAEVAKKYKISILKPERLDEEFNQNYQTLLKADLFIVVSFGKIIPQKLLNIPRLGAINLHGSLLPKYRGATPIQQAILNGDKETGITMILMDEKIDNGPILSKQIIAISEDDNYITLSNKMMQLGAPLLIKTIHEFVAGKIKPSLQNDAEASYCNLIKKEDGYFDLNSPPSPEKLDRMIRAYYPWPTAWTIWRIKNKELRIKLLPGGMVQMEGKKAVKLEEFLRGYPDFPIKSLVSEANKPDS